MRLLLASVLLALTACGGAAGHTKSPPTVVVAPPPPPPFVITTSTSISAMASDATHLYWADEAGIYRRALGPDQKSERMFAAEFVSYLAAGSTDLFFVDADGKVRALPLAGGAPRVVEEPENEVPWALYAEGDTVWYAFAESLVGVSPSGRRTISLGSVNNVPFAAAAGAAYVIAYDDASGSTQLVRIDLATDTRKTLSSADFLGDAQALAVVGDNVVVAISDGVIAVPTDGGKVQRSFFGSAGAVAGDANGYAVGGYGFVVTHAQKQAPHLVATSTYEDSVIGANLLALAGDYVYYTSTSSTSGDMTLRAAARAGGATMMRLPINASVTAIGANTGAVFAGLETEIGTALFQVGTRKTKLFSPSGWIDQLVVDDQYVVGTADGILSATERAGGELTPIGEVSYASPVLHKGRVYWGEGSLVRAAALPSGDPFQVIDASTLNEELADLTIGSVAFASDHMYFAVNYGERTGIVSVDEERKMEWLWTWEPGADEYGTLDTNVVAVGDHLYIHDGTYIYRVALDGTSKRVFSGLPKRGDDVTYTVGQLYAAGDHLIARVYGEGDALLEIATDGGKAKSIWETTLDGGGFSYLAVAPDAVYIHVAELGSIVKLPL